MERIDSLILLLGMLLSFGFFWFWNQWNPKKDSVKDTEWFGLYLFNMVAYVGVQILFFGAAMLESNSKSGSVLGLGLESDIFDLSLIASANLSFGLYFLFARIFLMERIFLVRILFLVLISILYHPLMQNFIFVEDGWGATHYFLSLVGFVFVGYVFFHSSSQVKSEDKLSYKILELDLTHWVVFFFGLLHIGFLSQVNFQSYGMEIFRAISNSIWVMSIAGLVSWLVHRMSGRNFPEDTVLLCGLLSGFAAYSSLPLGANLWHLSLLGFVSGLLPAVLATFALGNLKSPALYMIFLGAGWGALIGYLGFPLLNYPDRNAYESLLTLQDRGISILLVLFSSLLIGWIGVGLAILVDKIFPPKPSA
jgi:hypothetical protein